MCKKVSSVATLLLLSFVYSGCNQEMEFATILGKWSCTKADFAFNLLPVHNGDLNLQLEFFSDETMLAQYGSQVYSGTYKLTDERLVIKDIALPDVPMNFAGVYEVKTLTDSKLVLYGERMSEYQDPSIGTVTGKVKATLSFNKAVN